MQELLNVVPDRRHNVVIDGGSRASPRAWATISPEVILEQSKSGSGHRSTLAADVRLLAPALLQLAVRRHVSHSSLQGFDSLKEASKAGVQGYEPHETWLVQQAAAKAFEEMELLEDQAQVEVHLHLHSLALPGCEHLAALGCTLWVTF